MAVPTTGAIRLGSNIRGTYGGTGQDRVSEYYRKTDNSGYVDHYKQTGPTVSNWYDTGYARDSNCFLHYISGASVNTYSYYDGGSVVFNGRGTWSTFEQRYIATSGIYDYTDSTFQETVTGSDKDGTTYAHYYKKYYRTNNNYTTTYLNQNVPTSGTVRFSNYRGGTN